MAWSRRTEAVVLAHEDTEPLAEFRTHLEFLGYTVTRNADEWLVATHPTRPNVFAKELPLGVRLVAMFTIGHLEAEGHAAWLAYVNHRNGESTLVKFALVVGEGEASLRVSALFPPAYERTHVGVLLDMWHRELDPSGDEPPLGTAGGEVTH